MPDTASMKMSGRDQRVAHVDAANRDATFAADMLDAVPQVLRDHRILTSPQSVCHLVLEGCVARVKTLKCGARQIQGLSIAGDLQGLFAGSEQTLQALGDAIYLPIEQSLLWNAFATSRRFAGAMQRQMSLDAAIAEE